MQSLLPTLLLGTEVQSSTVCLWRKMHPPFIHEAIA